MRTGWKVAAWVVFIAAVAGALLAAHLVYVTSVVIEISGAVIRQEEDLRKQTPLAGVRISTAKGLAAGEGRSDSSGYFRLPLRRGIKQGQTVKLLFRHPGYETLEISERAGDKLLVARLVPIAHETGDTTNQKEVTISNVRVRYSVKSTAVVNVGSVIKTFQAVNSGNVPCDGRVPCSPDGKWKATMGSLSLDAGQENKFRNARAACIAGPCPFTKIGSSNYSDAGRILNVSALNWSDTTTFLVEVEVVRPMVSDVSRKSYPEIFGEAMNFTLPVGAEGVSVEAEWGGTPIVFPLGPDLILSWADCNSSVNSDHTKAYRCELKPGYRFR